MVRMLNIRPLQTNGPITAKVVWTVYWLVLTAGISRWWWLWDEEISMHNPMKYSGVKRCYDEGSSWCSSWWEVSKDYHVVFQLCCCTSTHSWSFVLRHWELTVCSSGIICQCKIKHSCSDEDHLWQKHEWTPGQHWSCTTPRHIASCDKSLVRGLSVMSFYLEVCKTFGIYTRCENLFVFSFRHL